MASSNVMFAILLALGIFVCDLLRSRSQLQSKNLFLRHQLNITLRRVPPRPRLRGSDRALLVWMTQICSCLFDLAQVVKPETILPWHRAGIKAFWRWNSRNRAGRPRIDRGLRGLIQRMSKENPRWDHPGSMAKSCCLALRLPSRRSLNTWCGVGHRLRKTARALGITEGCTFVSSSPKIRCHSRDSDLGRTASSIHPDMILEKGRFRNVEFQI